METALVGTFQPHLCYFQNFTLLQFQSLYDNVLVITNGYNAVMIKPVISFVISGMLP